MICDFILERMTTIFKAILQLDFKRLVKLLGLLLRHPLFAFFTLVATIKTFKITNKKFPETHHKNGKGNAFRHALWCCLIMMYCCKISSPQKSLKWCKQITDLHEELFVNEQIARAMDLHNNQIGMNLFMTMLEGIHRQFFETLFFMEPLYEKSQEAKLISSIEEIEEGRMAIIEDVN